MYMDQAQAQPKKSVVEKLDEQLIEIKKKIQAEISVKTVELSTTTEDAKILQLNNFVKLLGDLEKADDELTKTFKETIEDFSSTEDDIKDDIYNLATALFYLQAKILLLKCKEAITSQSTPPVPTPNKSIKKLVNVLTKKIEAMNSLIDAKNM